MDIIIYWYASLARVSKRSVSHYLVRHLSSSLQHCGVEVSRYSSRAFWTFMRYMLVCGKWVRDPQISCGSLKLTSSIDPVKSDPLALADALRSAVNGLWCYGGLSFAYQSNDTMTMVSRAIASPIDITDDDHFDILQDMKENWGLITALESGTAIDDDEAPQLAKMILSS